MLCIFGEVSVICSRMVFFEVDYSSMLRLFGDLNMGTSSRFVSRARMYADCQTIEVCRNTICSWIRLLAWRSVQGWAFKFKDTLYPSLGCFVNQAIVHRLNLHQCSRRGSRKDFLPVQFL